MVQNMAEQPPLGTVISIIVNWNLRADTLECLHSLFAAGALAGSVIVVDNGSTDGSVEAIRSAFGDSVGVIETGENLGLAGGINVGVRRALEMTADWIFLLNNDTLVAPDLFEQFASAASKIPEVAIWGPQILFHADPERIWFLAERRVAGTLLGRRANASDRLDPALAAPFQADYISGCAMLVRRDVFQEIGGYDPTFFLFAEEVDFCQRARSAGFVLGAAPQAHVLHKVSLSTNQDPPRSQYLRIRNQIWFYRRYSDGWQSIFYFLFTWVRTGWLLLKSLLRGRIQIAIALTRGWVAGWLAPAEQRVPGYPEF